MVIFPARSRSRPLLCGAGIFFACGCQHLPEMPVDVRSAAPDAVAIGWVHAYAAANGIRVNGTVRRVPGSHALSSGQIEIMAVQKDGTVLATATTGWGPLPNRGARQGTFSSLVRLPAPGRVDRVKVTYTPWR